MSATCMPKENQMHKDGNAANAVRKIRLNRETLRQISTDRLEQAAGGATKPCPGSNVCFTVIATCTICDSQCFTCHNHTC